MPFRIKALFLVARPISQDKNVTIDHGLTATSPLQSRQHVSLSAIVVSTRIWSRSVDSDEEIDESMVSPDDSLSLALGETSNEMRTASFPLPIEPVWSCVLDQTNLCLNSQTMGNLCRDCKLNNRVCYFTEATILKYPITQIMIDNTVCCNGCRHAASQHSNWGKNRSRVLGGS